MRKAYLRAAVRAASLSATMLAAPAGLLAPAAAQARGVSFDIPARDLGGALRSLAVAADIQILFDEALVRGKRSPAIRGALTAEAALDRMLAGSGLVARRGANGVVMVESASAIPSALGRQERATSTDPDVEAEIIVTAQKREESIQDVPIAISAFSAKALDEQKVEGGFDLMKAIPNVTFSKSNYSGYNFSIRGIGTKAVSATSDPGVAVSFNNMALIRNRLFEQEYFDVERVEVLRGPQGTLYGRNATAGVINMITAKPRMGGFDAEIKGEIGSYDTRRLSGFINVPIGDTLALRAAGAMTKRSGYGVNLTTGNDVDDRDLWSTRVTLGFQPDDRFNLRLTWEHFEEDDRRLRTGKQLCHRDPGPSSVPGTTTNVDPLLLSRLSQGCKQGSLYDDAAFGAPNGNSIPFVVAGQYLGFLGYAQPFDPALGIATPRVSLLKRGLDPFDVEQSRNLREIESIRDGEYRAKADIFTLDFDVNLTDALRFSWQTLYNKDEVYSLQDYNRFATRPIFNDSAGEVYNGFIGDIYGNPADRLLPSDISAITPGGLFCDPQIGCSDTIAGFEISSSKSKQFSQEIRLQSSFDGPLNFSLGGNYLWFEGLNDYYLFYNVVTLLAQGFYNRSNDPALCSGRAGTQSCMKIDTNPISSLSGDGHNYFRNQNPYELESTAAFGELYWNVTPRLKVTSGLRFTHDRKRFVPFPSQLLVTGRTSDLDQEAQGPGYEYGPEAPIDQSWKEFTGRLGVDWKPELGFTDETMIYAFYSHGYKGGGANPPRAQYNDERYITSEVPPLFEPEYVDAFEIGTKNVLFGGKLVLNGTATYYKYRDYQVSKVVDRTIVNENFDAEIWSLEAEAVWNVTPRLRLNANIGYLDTRIGDGEKSIDIFNRNQGNPDWMVVTPWIQQTSNCIVPTWLVARYLDEGLFPIPGYEAFSSIVQACTIYSGDPNGIQAPLYGFNPADYPEINNGAGFFDDLSGNELPNAPHLTFNIGAQYTLPLGDMELTLRGDYYRQSDSFARVHNLESDRLRGWENANLSLTLDAPKHDLAVQVYAKNIFDNTPITDAFLNSDSTGMTTNIFTLDPRIIGFSIRKAF